MHTTWKKYKSQKNISCPNPACFLTSTPIQSLRNPLKTSSFWQFTTRIFQKGFAYSFPLGAKNNALQPLKGKEIQCTAGFGWSCLKSINTESENIYWDLEKIPEETEYYEPCLWIFFENITVKKTGVTYLEIEDKNLGRREYIPIIKEQIPPDILRFAPVAATIRKGQAAVLKWETRGAKAVCSIRVTTRWKPLAPWR